MHVVRRIRAFAADLPLARKLEAAFAGIVLVLTVVISLAVAAALTSYDGVVEGSLESQLDLFSHEIERTFTDYDTLSAVIADEPEVKRLMYELDDADERTAIVLRQDLRRALMQRMENLPYVLNMSYVDAEGVQVRAGLPVGAMKPERIERSRTAFRAAGGDYVVILPDAEYPYLQGGRHLFRPTDSVPADLGDFILNIDLWGIVNAAMDSTESAPSTFLIASGNDVLYASDPAMVRSAARIEDGLGERGFALLNLAGEDYYVSRLSGTAEEWTYIGMLRASEVTGRMTAIRWGVWITLVVVGLISFMVARRIARAVTRPIGQLLVSAHAAEEGRFGEARDDLPANRTHDEVGELTRGFDAMLVAIDELITDNYEKQILMQRTRYRMLRAQINPHFLYNTLGTVSWLVRLGKNDEAVRTISALGDVMRHALSRKEHSTAADEVAMLQRYIEIQEARFGESVRIVVGTSGDLGAYLLPHFTLQPLVENAVSHGAGVKEGVCTIRVSVIDDGHELQVAVVDDGAGMSAERLAEVRRFEAEASEHGIGLKNIHDRFDIMFQGQAQFEIESAEGEGTAVRICVPPAERVSEMASVHDAGAVAAGAGEQAAADADAAAEDVQVDSAEEGSDG